MRKLFESKGWKLPDDFNDMLDPALEPVYSCYATLTKTKSRFYERLQFSEIYLFVKISFEKLKDCDKLLLVEILIDIDSEWTNFLIEDDNAKNRHISRAGGHSKLRNKTKK